MKLSREENQLVERLFQLEHESIGFRLGLLAKQPGKIAIGDLYKLIGLIDRLSRSKEDSEQQKIIALTALLWEYREETWGGLGPFLIKTLSRCGFAPTATMLDPTYEESGNKFGPQQSFLDELAIVINQALYEVKVKDKIFLLTDFQKKVWDMLSEHRLVGISAPTSAGKSFVVCLKVIQMLMAKPGKVIYIVPTVSLVSQVCLDFRNLFRTFGIDNCEITTTYNSQSRETDQIFVLTQEKAISAFSQLDKPFENIRMLVVDEIQNLERVALDDDQRSKILYDALIELRHTCSPDLTIMAGPRVKGLESVGVSIFAEQDAVENTAKSSPVMNLTYSIEKHRRGYTLNQYSEVLGTPRKVNISNSTMISGYGQSQYRAGYLAYLNSFLEKLGPESINIIFAPTTSQARKIAISVARSRKHKAPGDRLKELQEFIRDTVHEAYDLRATVAKGVAYHHSKVPPHIKNAIERAAKDRLITNLVCTTTLMQGVNLPAQNVIIRNPALAIRMQDGVRPKLTNYEIANLRGRAGRLMKDLIGRTFVLDEGSFERESESETLFPEAEKTLEAGYGKKFNEHRKEIVKHLQENIPAMQAKKDFGYLITYIRQVILKHKDSAIYRLSSVGIELTNQQLSNIQKTLSQITIPVEVCYKNRYWDPLDLNRLGSSLSDFPLPRQANEDNMVDKLARVLVILKNNYPHYYNRYSAVHNTQILPMCIAASHWLSGRTLHAILRTPYYDTAEKIDDGIKLLQQKISYGLPMLLKPLYDLKLPSSMFLRFVEIGAFKPAARYLIESNIPRETALLLQDEFFSNISDDEAAADAVKRRIGQVSRRLSYWHRIQLEPII